VLLGLICGGVVFKEKNIVVRTTGTLLMVVGAVLITIYGSRFQVSGVRCLEKVGFSPETELPAGVTSV
jgi:hypothetical protein